jgi:hypothetical protein
MEILWEIQFDASKLSQPFYILVSYCIFIVLFYSTIVYAFFIYTHYMKMHIVGHKNLPRGH